MRLESHSSQAALPGFCQLETAVAAMSMASHEDRGAVYTRSSVVDFILDLSGYTADKPLYDYRLLEPSMGQGDFLTRVIDRLFDAYARVPKSKRKSIVEDLGNCIRAVELHTTTFHKTVQLARKSLRRHGVIDAEVELLCQRWFIQGDFLLVKFDMDFTHVVGNPPYVRQELIPDVLMAEYRLRYRTIYDRADIYIPFIERSLALLASDGALGFICADRWMKNRYGGPLRKLVAASFHLKYFVDMVDTDAFHSDVIAYPGIFVISRTKAGSTRVARRPDTTTENLISLARKMTAAQLSQDVEIAELVGVMNGDQPWMIETSADLAILRRLEGQYPTIEEAGCKVGIGVATGSDQVFIAPFEKLDVEPDRKLPLVMTKDIVGGLVKWKGLGVINPFGPDGKLVSLTAYPKLAAYLEKHGTAIKARHVSKKNPGSWYRTIDRIYPELAKVPKLLIPDIKGEAHIVFEEGRLYPHHNLYFVTSDTWDLRALQAVLLSDVTRLFIGLYSTKMRGGYLRFQAQYLRRLRLPHWRDVPHSTRALLITAGTVRDKPACNEAAAALYRLSDEDRQQLNLPIKVANAA